MSNITLTIPNDDHIALRAFGKALEEMALAHGAEPRKTVGELSYKLNIDTTEATAALERLRATAEEFQPEIDTTAQQVESLAVPMGDNEEQTPPTTDSTGTQWDERIHSTSKALNADGTWRLRRKPKDMDEEEWAALVETVKSELVNKAIDEETNAIEEALKQYGEEIDHQHYAAETADVEPPVTPPGKAFYTPENYVHMYRAADNIYALAKSDVELTEFEADGYVRHTQEQYDAWEGPNTADEGDDHHTDAAVVTEQTVAGIPPLPVPPPVVVAPPVPEFDDGVPFPPSDTVSPALERMADHTVWDFPRLMTFLTERHGKIDVATVNTLLAQDGMSSVQELNAHPDKIGPFVARVKAHLGE